MADYHLRWLCARSLCYWKIKWTLRRPCFTVRFDFPLQERSLNSWAIPLALQIFGRTKAKVLNPLTCLVKSLTWAGQRGPLSLLTHKMNYGQIKPLLFDLPQRSWVGCKRGEDFGASMASSPLMTQPQPPTEVMLRASPCLFIYFGNLGTKTITLRESS